MFFFGNQFVCVCVCVRARCYFWTGHSGCALWKVAVILLLVSLFVYQQGLISLHFHILATEKKIQKLSSEKWQEHILLAGN